MPDTPPELVTHWPYLDTLLRLALAVGTGIFVGLEREHRGKAGARTFAFAALLGCLGGLTGDAFAILSLLGDHISELEVSVCKIRFSLC